MAIARALPGLPLMRFGVGVRSRFLDELVGEATRELGVEAVLSVGAGLDTRPWRLDLPAGLRWIEVDFPAVLDYKADALAGERPRCRVERVAADLNVASERQAMLAATSGSPTLLITEGLLMYLPGATVEALAAEAAELGCVRHWLLDLTSPAFAARARLDSYTSIDSVRSDGHLDGSRIQAVLEGNGWSSERRRTFARDMWSIDNERIRAVARKASASPEPRLAEDPSGVHLFSHG